MDQLRRDLGLALVFVSHDLAVVRRLCEQLAVMYTGRIVETGPTDQLLSAPLHPYTQGLLEATLDLDQPAGAMRPIPGTIPEPGRLPPGCSFHPRCRFSTDECARVDVRLLTVSAQDEPVARQSACLHWTELSKHE